MSPTTAVAERKVTNMNTPKLTQLQQDAIDKIQALQRVTKETGFRTTRSVNDILAVLNAEDLAQVAMVVFKQ